MRHIAVLGAKGQLGSALMTEAPNISRFKLSSLTHKDFNIADERSLNWAIKRLNPKPEIIINTVAYTNVARCEEDIKDVTNVNIKGVKNLAKICARDGYKLIQISSDHVFGEIYNHPIIESTTPSPLNYYGVSKLQGELFIQNELTDYQIIRTSNLFGVKVNKNKGTFLVNILKRIKALDDVVLNDSHIFSPTYAKHLARFILKNALEESGIYHACNSGSTTPMDLILYAINEINEKGLAKGYSDNNISLSNYITSRVKRPMYSHMSTEKITPYIMPTWQEAVSEFLSDFRKEL